MGVVYLAETAAGDRVALKVLTPELARDDRFRQRFLRESQVAASLDHPNAVRVFASGEEDGLLYLAMACVSGSDLRELLCREERLDPDRAVALVGEVAGALDAAHHAGLVHRDVKPGNILVAGDQAYICDFGLARHVSSVSSLTGERGFVGTIDYVPPEQIEGGKIDVRADVYSLGCVLYECLAGEKPFARDSELSVVFAHLNEPPPRITDVRPELPAAFDEVFATALAKDPADRYPTCGELAAAARDGLRGKVRRPRRRRRLVAAGLVAAIAAGAAAAAAALTGGSTHHVTVAITQSGIAGARLGDSDILLEQMWNGGQKLSMQYPPNYSVLRQANLDLSAYFSGESTNAVQISTWNAAARTPAGVGPCSTLAELKKAYGTALVAARKTPGGVFTYYVRPHLLFAMAGKPVPNVVQSVSVYENPEDYAGFNALNDGPCTGSAPAPAPRPKALPRIAAPPPLVRTLSSKAFTPRVSVRVPAGWSLGPATRGTFTISAPSGASMRFVLDPAASTASGQPRADVSSTPAGLEAWLQTQRQLQASAPVAKLAGKPPLSLTEVDLSPQASAPYLAFAGGPALDTRANEPTRLWLTSVRFDAYVHTLAIVLDAPSQKDLQAVAPAADAVVGSIRVAAAPAPGLSALSTQCTKVFGGTCLGELAAGTHSTSTFRPKLTYTVPVGWTNFQDQPGEVGFVPPGGDWQAVDPEQSDYIGVFTSIRGNPNCDGKPVGVQTPSAFVAMLRGDPRVRVTQQAAATIGGLHGYVLTMRDAGTTSCPWSQGKPAAPVIAGLAPTPTGMAHEVPPPPGFMRLYLLGYKRGTLGIEVDEIKSGSKLDAYSAVVRSFRFAPSG